MSTCGIRALALGLFCLAAACSGGGADATASCKDLCTGAGFTSYTVDAQSNETNCFCTGGTGNVDAAACTKMCTALGKGTAQAFKSKGTNVDACQCS
jgi:hypothetical protein